MNIPHYRVALKQIETTIADGGDLGIRVDLLELRRVLLKFGHSHIAPLKWYLIHCEEGMYRSRGLATEVSHRYKFLVLRCHYCFLYYYNLNYYSKKIYQ